MRGERGFGRALRRLAALSVPTSASKSCSQRSSRTRTPNLHCRGKGGSEGGGRAAAGQRGRGAAACLPAGRAAPAPGGPDRADTCAQRGGGSSGGRAAAGEGGSKTRRGAAAEGLVGRAQPPQLAHQDGHFVIHVHAWDEGARGGEDGLRAQTRLAAGSAAEARGRAARGTANEADEGGERLTVQERTWRQWCGKRRRQKSRMPGMRGTQRRERVLCGTIG